MIKPDPPVVKKNITHSLTLPRILDVDEAEISRNTSS